MKIRFILSLFCLTVMLLTGNLSQAETHPNPTNMKLSTKAKVGAVVTTGVAVAGTAYYLQMKRLVDNLETNVKPRIHKLDLKAAKIVLATDIYIKNPTSKSIPFSHPSVKLKLSEKGEYFASSTVSPKTYNIVKHGEMKLTIYYDIPLLDLGFLALDILKNIQKGIAIHYDVFMTAGLKVPFTGIEMPRLFALNWSDKNTIKAPSTESLGSLSNSLNSHLSGAFPFAHTLRQKPTLLYA